MMIISFEMMMSWSQLRPKDSGWQQTTGSL